MTRQLTRRILAVAVFAIAFAFVESSVVVYLRALYYPDGFSFPLRQMSALHVAVELVREGSTIVMLAYVGLLAGGSRWQKFAYFALAFGVWDIFYYAWLKIVLDWPSSVLDLDILFLIPSPWIGPVIAPVLVAALMIAAGLFILRSEEHHGPFRTSLADWILAMIGTVAILLSFIIDTDAGIRFRPPQPYHFEIFAVGMIFSVAALVNSLRKHSA